MIKFLVGAKVVKKGAHQQMEVVGDAGLVATSVTRIPIVRKNMIVCRWVDSKGRTRSREFASNDLQLVEEK